MNHILPLCVYISFALVLYSFQLIEHVMLDSIEKSQMRKILLVMFLAKSPIPLGFISLHTGIKEPLKISDKMERMGLIKRSPCSSWSASVAPLFCLTSSAQKNLLVDGMTYGENFQQRSSRAMQIEQ